MRIIFHLGTYKTGTSSFQDTLFKNRNLLLENDILYPRTGIINEKNLGHRHTPLVTRFSLGKQDVCPKALLDELKASDAKTAIFSSEAWSSPGYLSHLTRFVSILEDNGYSDCTGLLSLRNLADYQVSHYREFTINRNNGFTYPEYVQRRHGMFDYLLLVRSFRAIFGSRFIALPFDGRDDIIKDQFVAMGFGSLYKQMKQVDRANVKSLTAIEVEAMRCANLLKKPNRTDFQCYPLSLLATRIWRRRTGRNGLSETLLPSRLPTDEIFEIQQIGVKVTLRLFCIKVHLKDAMFKKSARL